MGIRRWRVKQLVKQEEKKKGKEEEEKEGREERKFKRNMSELVLSDIYVCVVVSSMAVGISVAKSG